MNSSSPTPTRRALMRLALMDRAQTGQRMAIFPPGIQLSESSGKTGKIAPTTVGKNVNDSISVGPRLSNTISESHTCPDLSSPASRAHFASGSSSCWEGYCWLIDSFFSRESGP